MKVYVNKIKRGCGMNKAEKFAKLKVSEHDQKLFDYFRSIATGQMVRNGYHLFKIKDYHHTNNHGYVRTSVLMAEAALGKPLPKKAIVHHVNGDTMDNRGCNLLICQDIAYHRLLHTRINALRISGDADNRKCFICHDYDSINNMQKAKSSTGYFHKKCRNKEYYKMARKGKKNGTSEEVLRP
jgi:hypothetical protein